MILLGEGGEAEFNTNLNFLLEDYGMSINNGKFYLQKKTEIFCKYFYLFNFEYSSKIVC